MGEERERGRYNRRQRLYQVKSNIHLHFLYLNGRRIDIKFLINSKGFLKELATNSNTCNIRSIIIIQTSDVLHNAGLISLYGGEYQKVLKVSVLREYRVLKDNLFEELNQLVGQIGTHEGLDSDGDVFRILGLVQCCLDHLVNEWAAVLVTLVQDSGPYLRVFAVDEIASLSLEERVLIADLLKE